MRKDVQICGEEVGYFAKILEYPDGRYDLMASSHRVFKPQKPKPPREPRTPRDGQKTIHQEKIPKGKAADQERAQSRARASVRRIALANPDFRWFVTLTIDPEKIDSYDAAACTKRLSQWLSNHVKRNGLKYVLVPELHKSGRIHYHGFMNDVLHAVDSGHTDRGGHVVYNLPEWDYGFTTAIEVYGDYHAAVGYCCKYIGKGSQKIGGRWYYSGGNLSKPVEKFVDIPYTWVLEQQTEEFVEEYGQGWIKGTPAGIFAGINGLNKEVCFYED